MKISNQVLFIAACAGLFTATAAGAGQGGGGNPGDNSPSYALEPSLVERTRPFTDTVTFTVTSAASPKKELADALATEAGVVVTPKVIVDDCPAPATMAECAALVTVTPASATFTAAGQAKAFTVEIAASATFPAGSYTYSFSSQATGPWPGGSGVTLNVVVAEPVLLDTTPPNVVITSPANGAAITHCDAGNPVSVSVAATDAESAISAAGAELDGASVTLALSGIGTNAVSGSGTDVVTTIGAHAVTAWATSEGGTGAATPVSLTSSYVVRWLPPLSLGKISKGGSTIPIKFTVRDCEEFFVADPTVVVVVSEAGQEGLRAVLGDGASSIRIDETSGQYIVNFPTASGAHVYDVEVFFADRDGNPFSQAKTSITVR